MGSINRTVPLALALASGLLTCVLFVNYRLSHDPVSQNSAATLVPMIVANGPLSETQPLRSSDLVVAQVAARPEGAFASSEQLIGRLPLVSIPKGQPILSSHLAASGAESDLWHRVTPGKRAIAVATNEVVGVGGFLRVGVHVDIIQVTDLPQGGWTARTIVQDVPVLATAQDDQPKGEAKPRLATSATLLVSPQQAEAISQACETGRIRLVLRAPNDRSIVRPGPPPAATRPTTVQAEVPAAPARRGAAPERARVAAAPPPRALRNIEVISGKDSEVVQP